MNREEILSMKAGREMDMLIAEKIFGGPSKNRQWYWWDGTGTEAKAITIPAVFPGPKFSTDISAAWEVVEKMDQKGISSYVGIVAANKNWEATFGTNDLEYTLNRVASLVSAPLAICRAALLATLEPQ